MQFCEQLPSCARKIAQKVASKSNNSNPSRLDFYCMDFYCAQLSRAVRTRLSLMEGVARSLGTAFLLEGLTYVISTVVRFAAQIRLLFIVQQLRAKIQRNRANCDQSGKFGGEEFKIMYFHFFTSSSKFCSEKSEIYHFEFLVLSNIWKILV